MLTEAENDALTRVGPGTPSGELLRRYWHVAAAACELTEESPVNPQTASAKAERLIERDRVAMIIGEIFLSAIRLSRIRFIRPNVVHTVSSPST